jgi:N-acetylglucosamine-6-sulfatase
MALKILLAAMAVLLMGLLVVYEWPAKSAQAIKPNIVIIMTDDQNVDSLPVMHNLMSYPEGSWVKFNNAFVNTSICCPARATVLTGQYAHTTGVTTNTSGDKLNDTNTLPVWLDQAGYYTGLIGKYLNDYPWNKGKGYVPPGWDYFKAMNTGDADKRTDLAINFINSSTSPFFLYLAYQDPHNRAKPLSRYAEAKVYVPPDPPNFNETDVSDKPRWIRNLSPLSQTTIETWRNERVASQRALLGVDDGIQRVVETLKAKGELDNTMIIFLSDHGFSWGAHRWIKKDCAYEECSRIPLFIRYPGLGGNWEENRFASNVDLASTIAEYANITPGLPQDGRSFLSVITNTATDWTEEVLLEGHHSTKRTFVGIRVPGWKYIEYINGDKELYDLTHDPYELENQANKPAYKAKQDELAQRLSTYK